jgi:hypothetical protein
LRAGVQSGMRMGVCLSMVKQGTLKQAAGGGRSG